MKLIYPLHIQRAIERLRDERPPRNAPEFLAWAFNVRQYAKRYSRQYLTFDVPSFYTACGIRGDFMQELTLKNFPSGNNHHLTRRLR